RCEAARLEITINIEASRRACWCRRRRGSWTRHGLDCTYHTGSIGGEKALSGEPRIVDVIPEVATGKTDRMACRFIRRNVHVGWSWGPPPCTDVHAPGSDIDSEPR